jgi:hypothetical protein
MDRTFLATKLNRNNLQRYTLLLSWMLVFIADSALHADVILTGLTAFDSNSSGALGPSNRWNTTPGDITANLYLTLANVGMNGDLANSGDRSSLPPNLSLTLGDHQFFVFAGLGVNQPRFGMNFFFDNSSAAGISVFAQRNTLASGPFPAFLADSSNDTLGLTDNVIPGAAKLSYLSNGELVTLEQFIWSTPTTYSLDRVSAFAAVPDSQSDFVASFTLRVSAVPEPAATGLVLAALMGGHLFRSRSRDHRLRR